MASRPLFHYKELDALAGEARVSYPDSLDFPRTERVYVEPIRKPLRTFGSAEPDSTNYPDNKLVACEVQGMDRDNKRVYYRWEKLPGYAQVTPFVDEETNAPGTITRKLVVKPSFPLPKVPGTLTTYTPLNDYCGYLTEQRLNAFNVVNPAALVMTIDPIYGIEHFTFPRRIESVVSDIVTIDGRSRPFYHWKEKPEVTMLTSVKSELAYGTHATLSPGGVLTFGYDPQFTTLAYDGIAIPSIAKGGVLCDEIVIGPYVTGGIIEGPVFPASSPSYTEYEAMRGSYRTVGFELVEWKYNLWRRRWKSVYLR